MQYTLYNSIIKKSNENIDHKLVSKLVIQYRKCSSSVPEYLKEKMKYDLFIELSRLTIKAVNNYFYLIASFPEEKIIQTQEDIANECFILYSIALDKVDVRKFKNFCFYLNSTYNRGIYRLFEKHYKKNYNLVNIDGDSVEKLIDKKKVNEQVDLTDFELEKYFDSLEIAYIEAKCSGITAREFSKKYSCSKLEFDELEAGVKEKMRKLYKIKDGEYE